MPVKADTGCGGRDGVSVKEQWLPQTFDMQGFGTDCPPLFVVGSSTVSKYGRKLKKACEACKLELRLKWMVRE